MKPVGESIFKRLGLASTLLLAPIAVTGFRSRATTISIKNYPLATNIAQIKQQLTTQKQGTGQVLFPKSSNYKLSNHTDLSAEQIEELREKAVQLNRKGDYAGAARYYERIVAWNQKYLGPDHPETGSSLGDLAWMYDKQGLFKEAEPIYLRALAINERVLGVEHEWVVILVENLAHVYMKKGLYKKAEPLFQRAIKTNEKVLGLKHKNTAQSLNGLGMLYDSQGLYKKAEPLYQRALAIYEKASGRESSDTAALLNNLATLYINQGVYPKAEPLLLRSLEITWKAFGADDLKTTYPLSGLARLYNLRGIHEKATQLYQIALEIREKVLGPEHPEISGTLINLARTYDYLFRYRKAAALYARALKINEKAFGVGHPSAALILNNYARNYENRGLHEKAIPLYQIALKINANTFGQEHPATASSLINLGTAYADKGLFLEGQKLLKRGLIIETRLIQRETPTMPRNDREKFMNTLGYAYEIVFSGVHLGRAGAELALFSRLNRQGLLEEIEKRQTQLAALPGEQQELAVRLRAVTQKLSSLSLTSNQRLVLRKEKEQLERLLYRLLPELKPRVVEVTDVAEVLPKRGALVEFQRFRPFDGSKKDGENWGEARYLALVLRNNQSIEVVDLGLTELIDRRVEKALVASEQIAPNAEVLWAEVGELVMQPLSTALTGVDTLVISPDGELNRLPFAALPAPGGGSLLAERFQLRLVTTGRELIDLKEPLRNRGKTPLVVANPDFDLVLSSVRGSDVLSGDATSQPAQADAETSVFTERGQLRSAETDQLRWDPLPGTKKEGEFVAGLLNGRLLVEQEARSNAVQQAKAPTVLHIASHAFFLPDQEQENNSVSGDNEIRAGLQGDSGLNTSALFGESPLLRSGIALAGANRVSQRKSGEEGDDGYLTALEVAQLNWKGTELVVISACESGKGEIKAGEGVYGLKRAIAVSGARSSLLSLWKVDDRATAAFMRSYYEKLKAGLGRAEALSSTQEEFRNHRIPMWRHPYVWAAFQLSGDWRPIEL